MSFLVFSSQGSQNPQHTRTKSNPKNSLTQTHVSVSPTHAHQTPINHITPPHHQHLPKGIFISLFIRNPWEATSTPTQNSIPRTLSPKPSCLYPPIQSPNHTQTQQKNITQLLSKGNFEKQLLRKLWHAQVHTNMQHQTVSQELSHPNPITFTHLQNHTQTTQEHYPANPQTLAGPSIEWRGTRFHPKSSVTQTQVPAPTSQNTYKHQKNTSLHIHIQTHTKIASRHQRTNDCKEARADRGLLADGFGARPPTTRAHVYVHVHMLLHMCMYTCIYRDVHAHVHVYMYMYTCYMYIYTRISMHIHVHVHMCVSPVHVQALLHTYRYA